VKTIIKIPTSRAGTEKNDSNTSENDDDDIICFSSSHLDSLNSPESRACRIKQISYVFDMLQKSHYKTNVSFVHARDTEAYMCTIRAHAYDTCARAPHVYMRTIHAHDTCARHMRATHAHDTCARHMRTTHAHDTRTCAQHMQTQ